MSTSWALSDQPFQLFLPAFFSPNFQFDTHSSSMNFNKHCVKTIANRCFFLLSHSQHHAASLWVCLNQQKNINYLHSTWSLYSQPSYCEAPYWGQGVPRVVGYGCNHPLMPSSGSKHTWAHSGSSMAHFLACLHLCMFVFAFHSQQLHSSSGWYVPSSSSLRWAEKQQEFLSNTNAPRRPNLSPVLWQFITGSKLYIPHYTYTKIQIAHGETSKNNDQSIATRSACLHV